MQTVLIVDDDVVLRTLVRSWAESLGFLACEAGSAVGALEQMGHLPAEIAFCDVNMAGQSGLWLAGRLRELYPTTAIIMATAAPEVDLAITSLQNEVVDYILKPFDRSRLREALALGRDWHAAALGADELRLSMADRLRRRRATVAAHLANAQPSSERALESLIAMLQLHERDGRGHATRVAQLALAIADQLNGAREVSQLEEGALLHDIGKLDMPRAILNKPAPLDDDEWRVMRTHPQVGYELLQGQSRFVGAAEIVRAHHESYDGSGYPLGLSGRAIPFGARILAVADAYDSMIHPHTQRPAMSPAMAVEEIERCSGSQFDPICAEALGAAMASAAAA
jgi:putative two-component system response regulator